MIPENERQYIDDGNSEQNVEILEMFAECLFPGLPSRRPCAVAPVSAPSRGCANHVQKDTSSFSQCVKCSGRADRVRDWALI